MISENDQQDSKSAKIRRPIACTMALAVTISLTIPVSLTSYSLADEPATIEAAEEGAAAQPAEAPAPAEEASAVPDDQVLPLLSAFIVDGQTKGITQPDTLRAFLKRIDVTPEQVLAIQLAPMDQLTDDTLWEVGRLQCVLRGEVPPAKPGSDAAQQPAEGTQDPAAVEPAAPAEEPAPAPEEAQTYPQWSYSGNTSFANSTVDATTMFVATIGERARLVAQEHGIYASVMIAQAILETGSGTSRLSLDPYYNYFGIKGSYEGQSVRMSTVEYDENATAMVQSAEFRAYPGMRESFEDYAELIAHGSDNLYIGALKENAPDYAAACDWLQGRYATDPEYAAKLKDLIVRYDLAKYDEPLDYQLVDTFEMPAMESDGVTQKTDPETGEPLMESVGLVDLIEEAATHLGEPYVWGGTTPGSFDCSGLVQYCYKTALGVDIPRTTFFQCLIGEDVDFEDLHMGDLVFFTNAIGVCTHVGMYLGEGCYIEAPHSGSTVQITSMSDKTPAFAKRILRTTPVLPDTDDELELVLAQTRSSILRTFDKMDFAGFFSRHA